MHRKRVVRRLSSFVAIVGLMAGTLVLSTATPAAASTFTNTGSYTATAINSFLQLAGRGTPSGAPTSPSECSDGINNDANVSPETWPPDMQDPWADAADPQCSSVASGTSTAGSTTSLTDSSKSWTANQWVGYTVVFTSGANLFGKIAGVTRTITSNTATVLNWSGSTGCGGLAPSCTGLDYGIYSPTGAALPGYQPGWNSEARRNVPKAAVSLTGTINSDGSVTGATASFPTIYTWTNTTVPISTGGVTTVAISATVNSASINPITGATNVNLTLNATASVPIVGACAITISNLALTSVPTPGVTDGPTPVTLENYNAADGTVWVGNNTYSIPGSTTGGLCDTFNGAFGLPSPAGNNVVNLRLRLNATGKSSAPTPSAITVTPATTVPEGSTITLNGGGTDTGNVPCVTAGPAPTGCAGPPGPVSFRWTQTAGPSVTWINGSDTRTPQVVLPQNGTYTFQQQVQDGGPSTSFAPTTTTVNVTATPVTATANAGPDLALSTSGPGNTNFLRGSSTDPAPGDPDATRSYTWTQTANTCTSPVTLSSTTARQPLATAPAGQNVPCSTTFQLAVQGALDPSPGTDTVVVSVRPIPPAGTIRGVVQSCTDVNDPSTCTPLAGALVDVFTAGSGGSPSTGSTYVTTSAPSSGDGSFSVSGLTDAVSYRLRYRATGHQTTWAGGGNAAGSVLIAPPRGNADARLQAVSGTGTISGTVTKFGGAASVANGTEVRLYNSQGYVARTTTSGGTYSFTGLPARNDYILWFGRANAEGLVPLWSDNQYAQGLATKKTVTGGGTTTVNADLNRNQIVFSGTASAGGNNTISVSGTPWTANAFVGMKVRLTAGTGTFGGSGQVRTIISNTTNQLTVSSNWNTSNGFANPAAGTTFRIEQATVAESGRATNATLSTTVLTDSGKNWTTNQWAGFQLRITQGQGLGQVRTISSNTANTITVSPAFTTGVGAPTTAPYASAYQIEPVSGTATNGKGTNALLEGGVTFADTGAAPAAYSGTPPAGTGVQVRVYRTDGSYVGLTTVGAVQVRQSRNYSFDSWTPPGGTATVGLAPGTYKVMFRVVGNVANPSGVPYCTSWATDTPGVPNVIGGPGAGSFPFAPTITLGAGELSRLSPALTPRSTCVAPFQ